MTENYSKQPSPDGIVFEPIPKDKRFKDITGNKYGTLTVLGYAGKTVAGCKHPAWWTQCSCGTLKKIIGTNLKAGKVISCGCENRKMASLTHWVHGMTKSAEHRTWSKMKGRCLNETDKAYRYYGGRGITVCHRWLESFQNFYEDMGPKPSCAHSIDRIDVNGNYEPSNCRWTTQLVQSRNKRSNRVICFNGKSQCASVWNHELGFPKGRILDRLHKGWSTDDALSTPVITKTPAQTASTAQHA